MTSKIERLAGDFANNWERISAIVEDMRDIEPDADLTTATLQGLLRELQTQTIQAIVTVGDIQHIGRVDGYPSQLENAE